MSSPSIHLTPEDVRYIRSRFVSLERVAKESNVTRALLSGWQQAGLFPRPTYVTEDGKEWYSRAYAALVRKAIARTTNLRALFFEEYHCALERLRRTDPTEYRAEVAGSPGEVASAEEVVEANWRGFVSGEYGVCLRVPWVPCMLRKGKLMRTIDLLVAHPHLDDPGWRRSLQRSVESLDRLEMPFAEWDRIRFGTPVSRDTHIQLIRERFPGIFGPHPAETRASSPSLDPRVWEELPC